MLCAATFTNCHARHTQSILGPKAGFVTRTNLHHGQQRPSQMLHVPPRMPRQSTMRITATSQASPQQAQPGVTRVGFLGMGIMGTLMAINLVKAGYEVTVWNRSPARCKPVQEQGARVGASPKEVVQSCDIVFGMLADPNAALEVAMGPEGVVAGMSEGKGYVDVSTVDAATSRQIANAISAAGGRFLEAPVSGSKKPAQDGQLIFLTAGDESLFTEACPLLDVMGKASFFLGDVGAGANMKLIVNMIMGTMMTSFAEGLSLAKNTGLKETDVVDVLALGAIACPMFALKGPTMIDGDYPPAFPLKHQQKDLRLALELGEQVGQKLPTCEAANTMYMSAMENGYADDDFCAVIEAVASDSSS